MLDFRFQNRHFIYIYLVVFAKSLRFMEQKNDCRLFPSACKTVDYKRDFDIVGLNLFCELCFVIYHSWCKGLPYLCNQINISGVVIHHTAIEEMLFLVTFFFVMCVFQKHSSIKNKRPPRYPGD